MLQREFQLRDAEVVGDGRTVVLACVPYDQPAWVDDGAGPYREVFRRGAFRHVVRSPNRVELRYAHRQSGMPYGFGVDLVENLTQLEGRFRVAPSEQGDQVLALVRDGQLNGVSIGYINDPDGDLPDVDDSGPVTARTRVKQLREVSLTPAPTWQEAKVLALREGAQPDDALLRVAQERARLEWIIAKARAGM